MAAATSKPKPAKPGPRKPASKPTAARHIRVPDEVWNAGTENAQRDGFTGVSELLRHLLRDYNAGKRMR